MKYRYDLHLHSALSPCGDGDMTPNNILNMAVLNGLQAAALTDHNSCKNCPAFLEAARDKPLLALPGMELTTSEEVHVVCLFPALGPAMAFDAYVHDRLPPIENRPDIFGRQIILNALDEETGEEPLLLLNATSISIEEVHSLVAGFGGVAFPAHVDKSSTSVLSNLGYFAPEWGFSLCEVADPSHLNQLRREHPLLEGMKILHDSDAHYLWDISGGEHWVECDDFLAWLGLSGLL
ncbi:MAG: PHP domain-containing protein [Oscillospiraceae bacterium]|nr:PHP domain-containing protein [Oscillospiraceae bacterium]MDY4191366.1 PHP domain-containing protein [Oscillospiraceae bacterium]